jgi:hypothetical protein
MGRKREAPARQRDANGSSTGGSAARAMLGATRPIVSRSVVLTIGCCLCAALLAVAGEADDPVRWTAYFAVAVLAVTTTLVAIATVRTLGADDDEDDRDDAPAAPPAGPPERCRHPERRRATRLPDRRLRP